MTLMMCIGARAASAQQSYIKLREPAVWADGKALEIAAGQRVHVSGVAFDSTGVRQVLVDGTPARLSREGDVWTFTYDFTATLGASHVVVAGIPGSGPRFSEEYDLTVTPPRPQIVASDQSADRPRVLSPGFKKRAFAYSGGVVVGALLATMKASTTSIVCRPVGSGQDCFNHVESKPKFAGVGMGLIGASVVAALIDYARSSHSAEKSTASP